MEREEEEPICVDDSTEIIAGSTSESASNKKRCWDETVARNFKVYLTDGTRPTLHWSSKTKEF